MTNCAVRRNATKNVDDAALAWRLTDSIPFSFLIILSFCFLLIGIGCALLLDTNPAGQAAWIKLAKFGASLSTYAVTVQWLISYLPYNRPLMKWAAVAASAGGSTVLIDLFLQSLILSFCPAAQTQFAMLTHVARLAILPPTFFLAVIFKALLSDSSAPSVLRRSLLWAISLALLGCIPAVLMLLPEYFPRDIAIQALAAKDSHEALKLSHFVGLHALQVMPVFCWLMMLTKSSLNRQLKAINFAGIILLFAIILLALKGILSIMQF